MSEIIILPRTLQTILMAFYRSGGVATLDRYNRPIDTNGGLLQGDAATWLQLVSSGVVFGRGGRLYLSDEGEALLKDVEGRRSQVQNDDLEDAES